MMDKKIDCLVLGGGAGGLAAAAEAARHGANVVLLDREPAPGGVLDQCIHHGFGVHRYREELTGPEFAHRLVTELERSGAEFLGKRFASLVDVKRRRVSTLGPSGYIHFQPSRVILATGARERPFGALGVPGFRPSGILTAGVAQRMVNVDGLLPGRRTIILGSGDIGLIMARRLHLEGVEVVAVLEQRAIAGGLTRNVVQCLDDFEIPLLLQHTVSCVHGTSRLEGVTVGEVDRQGVLIPGTEQYMAADTLVLSVGLIPDNELVSGLVPTDKATGGLRVNSQMKTEIDWLYAAGNNVIIYDLADWVARAGETAGQFAAQAALGESPPPDSVPLETGANIVHMVPTALADTNAACLLLRVSEPIANGSLQIEGLKPRPVARARPSEMIEVELSEEEISELCKRERILVEIVSHD